MSNRYALGLVSVSFRGHTPKEILEAMKANGLAVIEWGSDVHAPANDKEALLSIAALQAQYGITCSSYGTYFRLGVTPIEELEAYIAAAVLLGTDVLRLWCGAKSGADMWTPILLQNSDNVLRVMDTYIDKLNAFRKAISDGDEDAVRRLIEEANKIRRIIR